MFSFSTGPSWYHVFRAGAGRTREKCNRHKISITDHASREFPLSLAIGGTDKFGKLIGYVIPFDTLLGMWYLSMLGIKLIHVNDRDLRYLSPHNDLFSNLQGLITQHNTIIYFNIGERVINDAHDYFSIPRAMKLISFIWLISPLNIKSISPTLIIDPNERANISIQRKCVDYALRVDTHKTLERNDCSRHI